MNIANDNLLVTGAEAGLTGDEQIRIALQTMLANGGEASMQQIYEAVETRLLGRRLSEQGKASLRTYVNREAVAAGYTYPYDKSSPGWKITPEGREFAGEKLEPSVEQVLNLDTQQVEAQPSNSVRGAAFELYVLKLLKQMYPYYTWYHQGQHKHNERGLDFIGDRIGEREGAGSIGVQVKLHAPNSALTQDEWLKFLAGCFARRVAIALLITTGRLTSAQRREAGEARVTVIEGRDEVLRIAQLHGVPAFELFSEGE